MLGCHAPRRAESPTGRYFSIMTYNINRDLPDHAATVALIKTHLPDIVVLQETNPMWESRLRTALHNHYPYTQFKHHEYGGGLAILSKFSFHTNAYLPSPADKYPAWLVQTETPIGPLQILAVHLHAPVNHERQFTLNAWLTRGKDRLREIQSYLPAINPKQPHIILGDFNVHPNHDAARFLQQHNYINALDEFHPYAHTWHQRIGLFQFSNQVDHIYYKSPLYCFDTFTLNGGGSDHQPLIGFFTVKPQAITKPSNPHSN